VCIVAYMSNHTTIASLDDLVVGGHYRLKSGRMDWKLTKLSPPREGWRGGVVVERIDNIGRWHLKVLTARQIEAGALKRPVY
jgi:hypothetical protein